MCVCVYIPSLIEVNEKDHIISETSQSVRCRHGDDEGEHVVDEGIECLVKIGQYQLSQIIISECSYAYVQHVQIRSINISCIRAQCERIDHL